MSYYYYQNNEEKGPVSQAALQALVKQGIIPPGTKIKNIDTGESGVVSPPKPVPQPKPKAIEENPFTDPVPPVNRKLGGTARKSEKSFGATMASTMNSTMHFIAAAIGMILVIVLAVFVVWMLYSLLVLTETVPSPPAGSWLEKLLLFGSPAVQKKGEEDVPTDNTNQANEVVEDVVKDSVVNVPEEPQEMPDNNPAPAGTTMRNSGGQRGQGRQRAVIPRDGGTSPATIEPKIDTASTIPILPDDDGLYYFNSTYTTYNTTFMTGGDFYIDSNNRAWWVSKDGRVKKYMDNVRSIYEHDRAYFFITTNNELWGMGVNHTGLLGDDTGLERESPIKIMSDVANLYFTRYHERFKPYGRDAGLSAVAELSAVYALKTDKSRWGWGAGIKANQTVYAPIKIDDYFNHNQQLLADHISMKNGNPEIYTLIPLSDDIEAILGGKENITTSIEVKYVISRFASVRGVRGEQRERPRYYAITKDGVLWGWGYNAGNLGDGTRADRAKPVKIAENAKRLLPEFFITKSNDWYYYSMPDFKPGIAMQNVLYVLFSPDNNGGNWFTPDGKLVGSSYDPFRRDSYEERVFINDIKLPSIVRAADGRVIVPRPEQIVPHTPASTIEYQ